MAETPGDEVRVEDLELGRMYYVRENAVSELKKITIRYKEWKEYYTYDNRYFVGDWVWSKEGDVYMKDKRNQLPKFYKVKGELYSDVVNAARKIFPRMLAYSARPPGTMGPENTGGLLYKRWKRQFEEHHSASRRRRSRRRQTRRRR